MNRTSAMPGSQQAGRRTRRARQRRSLIGFTCAGLATAVMISACSSSGSSSSTASSGGFSGTYTVGAVLSLSGALNFIGQPELVGLQAEANYLNKHDHGILGKKVVVVYKDDGSDPQKAISATQQLTQSYKLDMFYPDPIQAPSLLPLAKNTLIITSCTSTVCTDGSKWPYAFTDLPAYAEQITPLVAYAKQQSLNKVGILVDSDPDNGGLWAVSAKQQAQAAGLTVTGSESYDTTATNVTSQLQQLKASGATTILTDAVGTAIGVVMSGVQALGWKVKVVGDAGAFTGNVQQLVPAAVQSQLVGVIFSAVTRTGSALSTSPYYPLVQLVQPYGQISNLLLNGVAADALGLAKWASTKAGSTDTKAMASALDNISSATLPSTYLWIYRHANPGFTATNHGPSGTGLTQGFYSVVTVSPTVSGTYLGTPLQF
jgi:branched-chain amino acid transport system substrate-binding protein